MIADRGRQVLQIEAEAILALIPKLDERFDRAVEVLRDCMTPHPKTIGKDALAARALEVMERHAITSLLIVDPEGRPEGAIHLHDLLRAGVV